MRSVLLGLDLQQTEEIIEADDLRVFASLGIGERPCCALRRELLDAAGQIRSDRSQRRVKLLVGAILHGVLLEGIIAFPRRAADLIVTHYLANNPSVLLQDREGSGPVLRV